MKFRHDLTKIAVFIAVALAVCVPQFSFAYNDAEIDTEWFDSTNLKEEYHISTKAQLLGFASLVNEEQWYWKENAHETFEGVTFVLENDITLDEPWEIVGDGEAVNFAGVFDGNGHTIRGLQIHTNEIYVGFFGYLTGTVKNLKLEGTVTSENGPCGAFAGYVSETGCIQNCRADVKVTGRSKTGGIAGFNDGGRIDRCRNFLKVSGTKNVGGVVGENWGDLTRSGNHGNVRSSGRGTGTFGTGGVAGRSVNRRTLDRCFNTGNIVSGNEATGGVVGYTTSEETEITNSYNTGNIKMKNGHLFDGESEGYAGGVAGIVGVKGVKIKNCYNAGEIENSDTTGGIIGQYLNESEYSGDRFIKNNYFANVGGKGIGADFEGHGDSISGGTKQTGTSALSNGADKLGKAYTDGSDSRFMTGGMPILKWQAGEKEQKNNKKKSDMKYGKAAKKGKMIIALFNPKETISEIVSSEKEKRSGDYLIKAREALGIEETLDEPEGAGTDEKTSLTQEEMREKAIAPIKKKMNRFEKKHPEMSRRGYAVLRYFAPVIVKIDDNYLDNYKKRL